MLSKTKVALSAAIVLSIAFPASAATKHHHVTNGVTHDRRAIYNMVAPRAVSGGCTPSGGPACSGACLPSGPPCAPIDGW
jgi:hypothetical protein